jgi:hypothetical protein
MILNQPVCEHGHPIFIDGFGNVISKHCPHKDCENYEGDK